MDAGQKEAQCEEVAVEQRQLSQLRAADIGAQRDVRIVLNARRLGRHWRLRLRLRLNLSLLLRRLRLWWLSGLWLLLSGLLRLDLRLSYDRRSWRGGDVNR